MAELKIDHALPDENGRFGKFGGRFVPEVLRTPLLELEEAYRYHAAEPEFQRRLWEELSTYSCRPTPLYYAPRLSEDLGRTILLKREDLNHTGAHKLNNTIGQVLLAQRMGKQRIVAETGAGQHGVATAAVSARFGMACRIYMGAEDMRRQRTNVLRMELMGADVRPVVSGSRTLKDAINEAIRDWVAHADTAYYLMGSVVGPHPYPMMVRDFQSCIGREAKQQCLSRLGTLPKLAVACVGGGSNAMGLFHAFLEDAETSLVGVEAAGMGVHSGKTAATLNVGSPGVLHGAMSYVLQNEDGQVQEAHSAAAGLDYPSVGPEHSFLHEAGRVRYTAVEDSDALAAFETLSLLEGIIPALESAHALAWLGSEEAKTYGPGPAVVCLSGRGDKDLDEYLRMTRGAAS
jgi:tryptophan synthase beta chain